MSGNIRDDLGVIRKGKRLHRVKVQFYPRFFVSSDIFVSGACEELVKTVFGNDEQPGQECALKAFPFHLADQNDLVRLELARRFHLTSL